MYFNIIYLVFKGPAQFSLTKWYTYPGISVFTPELWGPDVSKMWIMGILPQYTPSFVYIVLWELSPEWKDFGRGHQSGHPEGLYFCLVWLDSLRQTVIKKVFVSALNQKQVVIIVTAEQASLSLQSLPVLSELMLLSVCLDVSRIIIYNSTCAALAKQDWSIE